MHALVIEDQELFASLIADELAELGYASVDIAATEEAAIEAAEVRRPDLITADQRLATGLGVSAIRAICADRHIPFVFITSYREEVREEFPDAVTLGKPFWPPSLRQAIDEAIEVSHQGVTAKDLSANA